MFFELRQYHIRPGQQASWVKCMEEEIIPFQVKMGMVILGSFVGEEDAERLRLDPPLRERGRAQAALRRRLPERLLEERDLAARAHHDRPRADQGHAPGGHAALGHPVASLVSLAISAWAAAPARRPS